MSKVLTIRLSQSESEALTRIRATRELATNSRKTIKEILSELISDADVNYDEGLLNLPIRREVAELEFSETAERIAFQKSDEEHAKLDRMSVNNNMEEVEYGHADVIRELIKRFDESIQQSQKRAARKSGV